MHLRWNARKGRSLVAGVATAAALLSIGAPVAMAGGGGGNQPGSGGGLAAAQFWQYRDGEDGSWGPATSLDSVRAAMRAAGVTMLDEGGRYNGPAKAQAALDQARRECEDGFNRRHPNEAGQANCRVVAVGAVAGSSAQGTNGWNGSGQVGRSTWVDNWNKYVAPVRYNYAGTRPYYTSTPFDDDPSDNVNRIMERNVHDDTSIAVIVLDKYQPAPPVVDYDLTVTTNVSAPRDLRAGSADRVSDVIHASQSTGDAQQVDADVVMRFDGNKYVGAKEATKRVRIVTRGDTRTPEFAPADFGWSSWPAGSYWFDVRIAKQGHMKAAVDTADREASESFRIVEVPPAPPAKNVQRGVSADQMRNTTLIESGTGRGGYAMEFRDVITPNGVPYRIENMRVTDKSDENRDISNQFTMNWDQASNTVTAVRRDTSTMMPLEHTYVFSLDVVVAKPDISKVADQARVLWNDTDQHTDVKEFPTWKPNPDKSWIRQDASGKWAAVIDPEHTNATGADQNVFLDGDKVASVVNGVISADLIEAPNTFTLEDDWTAADYIFDADVKGIRVYMLDAPSNTASSVFDIVNKGQDVTGQFDIHAQGTKAVARMRKEPLNALRGLDKHRQYTLLVPGKVNFANGKGTSQVRADFGKQPGDELTFCEAPANGSGSGAKLKNAGAQSVNSDREATNEPWICGYVPPVKKDVLAESSQGGGQESVDGKVVFPGQKVEYQLTTTPKLPGQLAYDVKDVVVTDQYDQYLVPDKQTVEVTDLGNGRVIAKSQYTTRWDDAKHLFQLVFNDAYVKANWGKGQNPRVLVRFEGTVSKTAPADMKVGNQWMLTLNNSITPSNEVFNTPPEFHPVKEDTQQDPTISIDGKTALLGDTLYYRVGLDLKNLDRKGTAYDVKRAGVIDDYDQEYLTADEQNAQVLDSKGRDVTAKFNIQFRGGVAYVFARTVDTEIPATGETVKGDPQPADLKAYSERRIDPLKDPSIDQSLLGQEYTVVLPMTVTKVSDGYVVRNTATQIVNDVKKDTNTVSNPLKPINPSKDVVVNMGDESANGKSIYLNSTFLYQLDSSTLPADRAYQQVNDWRIVDKLDTTHDRYTGQWAVYATRDLKDGDTTLASTGERIAGSGVDSSRFGGDLFTVEQREDGTITVTATRRYLDLVSAANTEAGWRAYIQCKRIATGERIDNRFVETVNGVDRPSNEVWTHTPDQTPSIDVEKYDLKSGEGEGDRDDPKQAKKMDSGDEPIGIKITNTGKVDLARLTLKDALLAGSGELKEIEYPKDWDKLVLKPGQSVTLKAKVVGVKTGDKHTNRVSVTGTPIVQCPVVDDDLFDDKPGTRPEGPCYDTPVHDSDDWNAYRVQNPVAALATTGAGITTLVVIALAAVAGGVTLAVLARRRTDSARHMSHK